MMTERLRPLLPLVFLAAGVAILLMVKVIIG